VRDPAELLRAYDAQLRARVPNGLPASADVQRDGPVLRLMGLKGRGYVEYHDLGGIHGAELDELIARQVAAYAPRGERFEWKLHGHDEPADLPQRLRAAGFMPEDEETVVIARVADVAGAPSLPAGVSLREVTERRDFERIADMELAVWGEKHSWLVGQLEEEVALAPDGITIVVAEGDGEVVCAGWVRFEHGTDFATLWGGATLPAWRGRGIYRATVRYRASLGAARGFRFVSVDASANSRPILERLGFTPVTTTTPYVWSPS
jgi:ribosomal protein S18 acetylase RimI-like enzyme